MSIFDLMFPEPGERIDKTVVNKLIISTVITKDMGPETAIIDSKKTYIVERYPTKEKAEKGHAKWVKKAKKGLTEVTDVGYGNLQAPKKVKLKP